jgi:hypothetical protein
MIPSSNEQKPKIFVAGLSWAMGEWAGAEVVHGGIQQYFSEAGYQVVNSAKPRTYHQKINQILDQKLTESYQPGDVIFWIQADPLTDLIIPEKISMYALKSNNILPKFSQQIQQAGGLKNLVVKQQQEIYSKLNQTAQQYNTQIYCIGGTFNINQDVMSEFTNLVALVPSWIYLLLNHFSEHSRCQDQTFGVVHTWDPAIIDFSMFNKEFKNLVSAEAAELIDNLKLFREDPFQPDGIHPNKQAHRVLFDYLTKKLNLQ